MTVIAKTDQCNRLWQQVLTAVQACMERLGAHPSRTVVLLPYAQLMAEADRGWALRVNDGFSPRFETTRNWARQLQAFSPEGDDLSGDVARDTLTARALLDRAGQTAQRDLLAGPLQEAAAQLAPVVAAIAPTEREAWGEQARGLLPLAEAGSALHCEAIVARIALEWALASRHATDVLFDERVRASVDALVLLPGFQADPLSRALHRHWGERASMLAWAGHGAPAPGPRGHIALHAARDSEDEAQRAAACVLAHLQAGRMPVALAANDRALMRRIHAHLVSRGVAVRDENGWTLSTTRAAAQVMVWLHASLWDASVDAVLDALKHAPALAPEGLVSLERWLRRKGFQRWSQVADREGREPELPSELADGIAQAQAWRTPLQSARPLLQWLTALRALLESTGLWPLLQVDPAGLRVLSVLRLQDGQPSELEGWQGVSRRMPLHEFVRWVNEVLEAARFAPDIPGQASVVLLPLPQLLARPFAALVLPGCDEKRLQPSPEPPGDWSRAQREAWGLPTRDSLEAAQRAAWQHALQTPAVDVLWRTGDEGGEPLLASALVLALHGLPGVVAGPDARQARAVAAQPVARPQPCGQALPVRQLSSTAYADLRHCPYRFFALRLLGLKEVQELDGEVDKRDFGTWLHAVLQRFHEGLRDEDGAPDGPADRVARMDAAARAVTAEHGLGEGAFLPFAAGWSIVRDGYLRWLAEHEGSGARFVRAEAVVRQSLGPVELTGTLDRIDAVSGPGEVMPLVIDYKTENGTVTAQRIRAGTEDLQLAFYAALLEADTLRAAYVNVGERGETRLHEQVDVIEVRDLLVQGILQDMDRIAQGAPLPALGEGAVCDYCAARGLCRKDFWQ